MQRSWFPAHKGWQRALSAVNSGFVGRMELLENTRGDPGRLRHRVCHHTPGHRALRGLRGFPCPSSVSVQNCVIWCCVGKSALTRFQTAALPFAQGWAALPQSQDADFALEIGFVPFGNTEFSHLHAAGEVSLPHSKRCRQGPPEANLWRTGEVSRCHLSAIIPRMRRGKAAAAQPTSAHPQRNLLSPPWAACLIRGSVKHSRVPAVLWFGPGGVKGQQKRGCCCCRVRHWHFPGCPARVCRHNALHHL